MTSKAKPVKCKDCKSIVGYTHKGNPIPTVYCVVCVEKFWASMGIQNA